MLKVLIAHSCMIQYPSLGRYLFISLCAFLQFFPFCFLQSNSSAAFACLFDLFFFLISSMMRFCFFSKAPGLSRHAANVCVCSFPSISVLIFAFANTNRISHILHVHQYPESFIFHLLSISLVCFFSGIYLFFHVLNSHLSHRGYFEFMLH